MELSVFSKIIAGELPCHKVYEDEHTFAFMDIHPIQPGMVVVVAKKQVVHFEDLPDEYASAMILASQKVMRALRQLHPDKAKIAVRVEGFDVDHAHMTIYPVDSPEEFKAAPTPGEPDHDELAKQAEQIRSYI